MLEKIVHDQRQLIEEVTGKLAKETPQIWALYKEVQDYYDQGMTDPDDVTLLFADDNWGQIRRLPTKNIDREGGFGVYYHFDYVGVPRNYKWLNTTQIEKVWQQMNLAYERRARQVWIVNVGDIKPMEFPLSFFMDLAWDPEAMSVQDLKNYPVEWAQKQFGHTQADEIAYLISQYSYLASHRKPELLNEDSYELGEMRRNSLIEGACFQFRENSLGWKRSVRTGNILIMVRGEWKYQEFSLGYHSHIFPSSESFHQSQQSRRCLKLGLSEKSLFWGSISASCVR